MVTSVFDDSGCEPGHRAPTANCVLHFHAPSKLFMKAPNSLEGTWDEAASLGEDVAPEPSATVPAAEAAVFVAGVAAASGVGSALAGVGDFAGNEESSKGSACTAALDAPADFATADDGAPTATETDATKAANLPSGRTTPLVIMVTPRYAAVKHTIYSVTTGLQRPSG